MVDGTGEPPAPATVAPATVDEVRRPPDRRQSARPA